MQKMEEFHLHLLEWTWVTEVYQYSWDVDCLRICLFTYLAWWYTVLPHLPHRHALRVGSDSIMMYRVIFCLVGKLPEASPLQHSTAVLGQEALSRICPNFYVRRSKKSTLASPRLSLPRILIDFLQMSSHFHASFGHMRFCWAERSVYVSTAKIRIQKYLVRFGLFFTHLSYCLYI